MCPQAPALLPDVGQGIADELADVRAAALDAVHSVLATRPDRILVVGDGGDGADEFVVESAGCCGGHGSILARVRGSC